MILTRLSESYTGSTLARMAVEVLEEEDIRRLVQSESVDWGETADGEAPAILWALVNKEEVVEPLSKINKINLEGDQSCDLKIIFGEKTLRVHKWFMKAKSTVFEASLRSGMTEERQGEINITDDHISLDTIMAMIHYIYTGELGGRDLDILEVAYTADKYNLPGWVEKLCTKLRAEEVTVEMVADMVIAGSGHDAAKELLEVAAVNIKARREIMRNKEPVGTISRSQDTLPNTPGSDRSDSGFN